MKKKYVKPSTTVVVMEDVCRFTSFSVIKGNSNGTEKASDEIIDNGRLDENTSIAYAAKVIGSTFICISVGWGISHCRYS